MQIIGLCGNIASGKTCIAIELRWILDMTFCKNSVMLSIAEPIKNIAEHSFGWDIVKDEKGRKLLQVIGSECGRAYNPNIWIDKLDYRLQNYSKDTIVIIDDIRFDNEVEHIENNGGTVFRLSREGSIGDTHISECGITKGKHCIIEIDNNRKKVDTANNIIEIITKK
jgi:hypothetical protein